MLPNNILKCRFKYIILACKRKYSFSIPEGKTYINGKWISANSGKTFPVLNPANGNTIANVPDCSIVETNEAVEAACIAFKTWKNVTAKERATFLRRMFELQMKNSERLAHIITLEGGKPLAESIGEINYGASFFEWFSEEARRIYGDIVPSPFKNKQMFFLREPVGVAGIITPWNFPNAMITRKVAAALAAGCTCVIKPAEDTPLSALAIAQLAEEAGAPPGVINVVTSSKSSTPSIGKRLCENPNVATISFTGSTSVGKLLLEHSASTVKKVSLELGGNAPFIVFNSANVFKAVAGAMVSKFRNSGQTCVCTNKILVQEGIYEEFIAELAKAMQNQLKVGEGIQPGVTVGPLINENAVKKVERHVQDALEKGAQLVLGGNVHSQGKNFFEPTLIGNLRKDMLICAEETFGPVAAVMKFSSEVEAIEVANSSRSGLAGYFYSEDISQIWRVAKNLEMNMYILSIFALEDWNDFLKFFPIYWASMFLLKDISFVKLIFISTMMNVHNM
ncbi:succinate-semialdehyde dehydrogenase, mitochondrial [Nephila pilipes]|uniref:Succinate-semialdehyde dehydrogenase, mitochondrial n=1 Tax=Nephila pilipes TaxID=299642 RepID=A0A8X6I859_NEPPI|nr:succinate-semialdehyde dehydrogenase, mitochondrial [Nephila pilipes]